METTNLQYAPEAQLLRINDVVALTTLSKSCINLWVANGKFPKPMTLSATLKVWRLKDVTAWVDAQYVCSDTSPNSNAKLVLKVIND